MLVGRKPERDQIERLLDGARCESGGTLAIRGEAGVGKSKLLAFASDTAGEMLVLRATGIASESELAFAGLLELLRPVLGRLDEIPAPQGAALRGALALGPARLHDRFAVGAATLSLLAAVADREPLLVIIDDAQWLDTASLEALLFAARRLTHDPVAVLLAVRADEADGIDLDGLAVLELGGLDVDATAQLAGVSAGSALTPRQAAQVHRVTRGNPLAVVEMVSLGGASELLDAPIPLSESVERAFAGRAELLSDAGRTALVVAAADDSGDAAIILRAVRTLGLAPEVLDEAESAGLVVIADGRLVFRHPLVRSAVYQTAPASTRRAAHAALAESLSGGEWQSGRRAWHRAAATVEPDEQIAAALEATAHEARERSGYGAAARALERAATLTPDGNAAAARLYAAADAYWHAGQTGKVTHLLDDALARCSDPLLRADIHHLRGRLAHYHGDCRGAYALLVDEGLRVAPSDPLRTAEMLGSACHSYLFAGDSEGRLNQALDALRLIDSGDVDTDARVTVGLGAALVASGQVAEAAPVLRRSIEVLTESHQQWGDAHLLARAANCHGWLEEYSVARDLAARALEAARRDGAAGAAAYCSEVLGEFELSLGHSRAASAAFSEAHIVGRDTGQPQIETWGAYGLSHVAAVQGRHDECLSYLAWAQECDTPLSYRGADCAGLVMGQLYSSLGETEAAIAAFEPAVDLDAELASYVPWAAGFGLVEAYARAGRVDAAARAAGRIAPHVHQAWSRGALACCLGLLADEDQFDAPFCESIAILEELRTPHAEARSRLYYGERLRRAGRRLDAREQLRTALAAFELLGAEPWAERTRAELRTSGETLRARRDASATEQLTAQELQVALIVAAGATNKEAAARLFLSTKTIEAHLHRTYRKLGIRSRNQLGPLLSADALRTTLPPHEPPPQVIAHDPLLPQLSEQTD